MSVSRNNAQFNVSRGLPQNRLILHLGSLEAEKQPPTFYEETDYCFDAKNKGFKIGVDVNSIVYHKEGNATGSKAPSKTMDLLQIKNRIKFHKKYLGGGIGIYFSLMVVILNRIKRLQFDRALEVGKYMFLGESVFFLIGQYFNNPI